MMVLLFYFLIAILTVITAFAPIGWLLTNLIIVPHGYAPWLLEPEKKHIVLAVGASSAFLVTKLKLARPVC